MEYTKWENGKVKHVLDFDRCIESLRERNADQDERIKSLVEENKRLKSEHYKDTELQNLQHKYDEENNTMVDRLKIMCNKNSYGNLVEEIIMIAIESALEEISEKMRTRLECRYNWLGDTDGLYYSNGSTEFLSIHLKEYRIALSDCQYKNIYTLIENILKEKLYDREDVDSNTAVVYLHNCILDGSDIIVSLNIVMMK